MFLSSCESPWQSFYSNSQSALYQGCRVEINFDIGTVIILWLAGVCLSPVNTDTSLHCMGTAAWSSGHCKSWLAVAKRQGLVQRYSETVKVTLMCTIKSFYSHNILCITEQYPTLHTTVLRSISLNHWYQYLLCIVHFGTQHCIISKCACSGGRVQHIPCYKLFFCRCIFLPERVKF